VQDSGVKVYSLAQIGYGSMRRITISVADDMHRALRLLAILEGKSFGAVVLEALDDYLKRKNAYGLDVSQSKDQR